MTEGDRSTRSEPEIAVIKDAPFDFSALQMMGSRYALLTEIARLLIRAKEPDTLVDMVIKKLTGLMEFERCSFSELDAGGVTYRMRTLFESRATFGVEDFYDVPIKRGVAGRSIRKRRTTYMPAAEDTGKQLGIVDPAMEGGSLRSVLSIPLLAGGDVYGAVTFGAERPDHYSDTDIKIARQVADMLALAYERQKHIAENESLAHDLLEKSNNLERAVENLKATNLELDTFIYSASHDLRAPLLSIAGLSDLARLALATDNKEELADYIDRIHRNVQRLDGVVIDILQVNRARRLEQNLEKTELHKLIGEVVELLAAKDDSYHVDIRVRCDIKAPIALERRRVRQVLNNLIANGVKYCDRNKDEMYVNVSASIVDGDLVLRVTDNGIGVPKGHEERIFEMFYRASNRSMGSGLGLYLVQRHANAMGGDVRFERSENETTFAVRIPLTPQDEDAA